MSNYPPICPMCKKETKWREARMDEPTKPYELTEMDKKLLKSFHIGAD